MTPLLVLPPKESPPKPRPVPTHTQEEIADSIHRGITFLLESQNKNGSWGSPRQTKGLNIFAPVPGAHHAFRIAVTSLCIAALIETGESGEKVERALNRGETWLMENLPRLRRATPTAVYNIWGHAYALTALARMLERKPTSDERRQKIIRLLRGQSDLLQRYESVDGGWAYYDFRVGSQKPSSVSSSFTTATVLVAMHHARESVSFPDRVLQKAIASIHRQQKPDFSYLYSDRMTYRPMRGINRPGGSLGRSQACNLALRLWGDRRITDEVMKTWLNRLFARNLWLDIGRKRPVPHESWFQVAGYFYYYGHYYAALCMELLEEEERPYFQNHLAHILLQKQESDGSWWDYPFYDYHQPYGTAFALVSLGRCIHQNAK